MPSDRPKGSRNLADDLRGASRLAIAATKGVTDVVESMHGTIVGGPDILGRPLEIPARILIAPVYSTIRGVAHLVGESVDLALTQLTPLLGGSAVGPERTAFLAALNGVLGDYLQKTGNPLAIDMALRSSGQPLTLARDALAGAFPKATGKVLVLVHGSCMSDLGWNRRDRDVGATLAARFGFTPVYLQYNSGLHISTNGHAFSPLLETLAREWPVPITDLSLVGHSMGGLVSRSACHSAETAGATWRSALRRLVCIGSPHHGAPLERGGSWLELLLGSSRYSAPLARLGQIRSAGVTDLRFGNVLDEHWAGRGRFVHGSDKRSPLPLPLNVACYAVAGTMAKSPGANLPGDGLVPVASALGQHKRLAMALKFREDRTWLGFGLNHLDLIDHPEVEQKLAEWLSRDP